MRRSLPLVYLLATTLAVAQTPTPPVASALPTSIIARAVDGNERPLTLLQVLDASHRANPTLLSGAEHASAVRAGEVTAGLRQNPSAIIGGQMMSLGPSNPNGPDFYQAGVQRLFERGGKREWRVENARSTTALTVQQLDDLRRQTDLNVRQAFSRMLYAQAALDISRQNLASYQQTVHLMKVRLDAGDLDRTDFDRVDLQLVGFESDTDNAHLALQQSSIALQTLIGIATPTEAFAIEGSLDPQLQPLTLEDLRNHALQERPDLKAAQSQVDANVASLKLAKANGTSDPTLEGEYERSGNANTFGASVNLPLRVFDRNQGEKVRAQHELESSRLALIATRNQVLSDVDSSWAAYHTAVSQDARYRDKYLAEASHVRDNLEFSYRHGNSTLLDYLSALSDFRQVNLAALNARLQLLLAAEQLDASAHIEVTP